MRLHDSGKDWEAQEARHVHHDGVEDEQKDRRRQEILAVVGREGHRRHCLKVALKERGGDGKEARPLVAEERPDREPHEGNEAWQTAAVHPSATLACSEPPVRLGRLAHSPRGGAGGRTYDPPK